MMIFLQAEASNKVIYGDDNRVDTYDSPNSMYRLLAESTAAMIPNKNLREIDQGIIIGGSSLEDRGMCKSERFSQQLTAANCSGFLVADNLLVTAGHCMRSKRDCLGSKWVFDYKVQSEDQTWAMVEKTSVYSCVKVIQSVLNNSTKDDWALIQLDRDVTDRQPLKYRTSGKVNLRAPLVVIGHPTGLPQKIADGANVRRHSSKYFTANLDTYGGNSGSAVFNADTGEVEGILVRGATDYVYDSSQGCRVSNRLSNHGGRGEDVTYITNIPQLK